jgi:hypothetical protein
MGMSSTATVTVPPRLVLAGFLHIWRRHAALGGLPPASRLSPTCDKFT